MQTSRVSSCNENFVSIRLSLEACTKLWDCKLRLTWPRPRAVDPWIGLSACNQPCTAYWPGSAKPRGFHGALNQTKRLSTWQSVTPPLFSASNQDTAFAAFGQTSFLPWTVIGAVRSIAQEGRRLFFLTQVAPHGREEVFCLSVVSQATFRALGTKRVGKMQRQIGVWGWLWHLPWGSGWFWRPQAKIRPKKVIKIWIFGILWRLCILCKGGARQAAEFRQEPRRSTADLYPCFLRTGRPKTANPCDSGLFCLLVFLERPFLLPSSQRDWPQTGGFPVDLFI